MEMFKGLLVTTCAASVLCVSGAMAGRSGDWGASDFNASLVLFKEIAVQKIADLNFGDVMINGAQNVIVGVDDSGVAKFRAEGDRNAHVIASVVQDKIVLKSGTSGANHEITVDNWTYGGNVNGKGQGQFDVNGSLQNIRVGATAHIKASTAYGNYSGSATLRVTYV